MSLNYLKEDDIHILQFLGDLNDITFNKYINIFRNILFEEEKFMIIFDLNHVTNVPLKFLWKQISIMKEIEQDADKKIICSSIITDSKFIRRLIKILFDIKEPVRPIAITNSKKKALQFCFQQKLIIIDL